MERPGFDVLARVAARVALALVSAYLLLLALEPHPQRLLAWDKAEHFVGGAIIAGLLLPAMPGLALGWLVAGLALSAALVELMQVAMPFGRQGDPADGVAGLLGALTAILVCRMAARLKRGLAGR